MTIVRRKGTTMELQKFFLAMVAPVGITLMGLALGIEEMFIAGLVFAGLVLFAGFLHWRMSRW